MLALLLLAACTGARAQWNLPLDSGLKGVRDAVAPDFSLDYGNWVQYGSGALCYSLKACGLESRSEWGRMLTSHLAGAGITWGLCQGMKYAFDRVRPDGSARSFPSGHSATAMLAAHWLHTEYGWRYPWVDACGYGIALATVTQRILRDKHWASDTMAGAALGAFCGAAGYWLADRILAGRKGFWGLSDGWMAPEVDYDPSLRYFECEFFYSTSLKEGQWGGGAGLQARIPLAQGKNGVLVRGSVSGFGFGSGFGSGEGEGGDCLVEWFGGAGLGRTLMVGRRWEAGAYALAGCAFSEDSCGPGGIAGASMAYVLGTSSKLKLFLEASAQRESCALCTGLSAGLYF